MKETDKNDDEKVMKKLLGKMEMIEKLLGLFQERTNRKKGRCE